jgi:hypothetical protein
MHWFKPILCLGCHAPTCKTRVFTPRKRHFWSIPAGVRNSHVTGSPENVYYRFCEEIYMSFSLPLGVSYSAAAPYVFGIPFLNETRLEHAHIIPRQHYDYEDRNMSDWMMMMWTNFIKFGWVDKLHQIRVSGQTSSNSGEWTNFIKFGWVIHL